jgi:hypothetical protein
LIWRINVLVSKDVMDAISNVITSGFFCNIGMQQEKYLSYNALSKQFNKKDWGRSSGEKTSAPQLKF